MVSGMETACVALPVTTHHAFTYTCQAQCSFRFIQRTGHLLQYPELGGGGGAGVVVVVVVVEEQSQDRNPTL